MFRYYMCIENYMLLTVVVVTAMQNNISYVHTEITIIKRLVDLSPSAEL